jgi:ATP-binding cassette subfamily B protein
LNIKEEKLYFDLNPIRNISGSIKINGLSYKFNDIVVINNFNATINLGKKVLITGSSGCGKSTLAKIISGFLEVKRNKVFIGNNDINDFNLWNLREQITYVSQNEYLFNNSLYENINLKNARDKNKIIDISKCMLIDEIVSKNKNGFNMLLEENASNISGGERQRIILARTFLKNSNIYILDETFSEINIDKERVILKNIFEKFKDKTIIVISHRFDNNDLYDEIYNMENYGNRRISKEL